MLRLVLLFLAAGLARASVTNQPPVDLLVVVGAPGEQSYESTFNAAADKWLKAAEKGKKNAFLIGSAYGSNQLATLTQMIREEHAKPSAEPFWLVLIGHGTFDGKIAKFNLQGPDISAQELAALVTPVQRPFILVNSTSASAPFLNALSGEDRIIVTATKSGWEENYARFGTHISESIADSSADIDKDGQTSLLEAFLMASRRVADFYEGEQRLATEHALLDDNGDGLGTPAEFFFGVRPVKKAEENATPDGLKAHQIHLVPSPEEAKLSAEARARRDELELELEKLRVRQDELPPDFYFQQLEKILVEISRLYHPAQDPEPAPGPE